MARAKNELDRYKRAMADALQLLDWCVSYLQGIQKTKIAHALARNRNFIAKQIDPKA